MSLRCRINNLQVMYSWQRFETAIFSFAAEGMEVKVNEEKASSGFFCFFSFCFSAPFSLLLTLNTLFFLFLLFLYNCFTTALEAE